MNNSPKRTIERASSRVAHARQHPSHSGLGPVRADISGTLTNTAPFPRLVATYVRQGAVSSVGNIIARLLGLLFSIVIARTYGPVGFGLVRYAIGVATLGIIIVGPIPNIISRYVAVHRKDFEKVDAYFSNAALLTTLVLAVSLIGATVYLWGNSFDVLAGAILVMCGTTAFNVYTELAKGLGAITRMSLYYVVCNLGQLIAILLVTEGFRIHSIGLALAIYGLSMIIPIVLFEIGKSSSVHFNLGLINKSKLHEVATFSVPIVIAHGCYTAWLTLDLLFIERQLGAEAAGIYSAAKTVVLAFTFIPYALITVALRYFARGSQRDAWRSVMISLTTSAGSSFALLAIVSVSGLALLKAGFGARYETAAPSLLILSAGMTMYGMYLVFEMWLVAKGYPWLHALSMLVTFAVSTSMEIILLPLSGMVGVAFGAACGIGAGAITIACCYVAVSIRLGKRLSAPASGTHRKHRTSALRDAGATWEDPMLRVSNYLKRWAWLIILSPLLASAATFGFGFINGATYEASESLVFLQAGSNAVSPSTAAQLAGTYQGILTSPTTMQSVALRLGLSTSPTALASNVHTSYSLGSNVIVLTADASSQDGAVNLASTVVNVSNDFIAQLPNNSLAPLYSVGAPTTTLKAVSSRNIALAGGGALFLALSVVGLMYYLDDTIFQPSDLQTGIDAPLLSAPLRPRRRRSQDNRAKETALLLLATLRRARTPGEQPVGAGKPRPRIVMYAWPTARDRSGWNVLDLATVASESGMKILVINMDEKYPWPEMMCQVPGDHGIIDVLSAGRPVSEVVYPLAMSGIAVVPAGYSGESKKPLQNPTLLEHVLKIHGPAVDLILVTAPPVLVDAVAATIATVADAVVLATREGVTRRRDLQQALTVLNRVHANVMGTVMEPASTVEDIQASSVIAQTVIDSGVPPAITKKQFGIHS